MTFVEEARELRDRLLEARRALGASSADPWWTEDEVGLRAESADKLLLLLINETCSLVRNWEALEEE